MSLFASSPFRLLTPLDSVRLSLMQSLHRVHRPELADLVETAELVLDLPGVWLHPAESFAGVGAASLEPALLEAATEAGLPLSWIRVLGNALFRRGMRQEAFWCRRCGSSSLCARGFCRACYDRARHSRLRFGGYRDQVLTRDTCCQLCWAEDRLIVHHRRPGTDRPLLQITLCLRCHTRLHRRFRLPGQYSELFFTLWREQHPKRPAQLALPLTAAA